MSAGRSHEMTRRGILDLLLGPAPRPGAVLRFAANHAPLAGVGAGTWVESVAPTLDRLVELLADHVERGDVYVSTAWFDPKRPKLKCGVVGKSWIGVEVDLKSMPGKTDEERRTQARSLAGCLPCPAVIVGSGGGYHVHVRLPVGSRVEDFEEPADGVARVELLGRALRLYLEEQARQLLGAPVELDHVHGAERVWRIPPSWNAKSADGARTLTADRAAWRPTTLERPGRAEAVGTVAAADLSFLTPYVTAAEAEASGGAAPPPVATLDDATAGGATISVSSVAGAARVPGAISPDLLPDRIRARWPMRVGDQSALDYHLCAALAEAGWAPVAAAATVRARRASLPDAEDRAKGARQDYVERTVREAFRRHAATTRRVRAPEAFPVGVLPEAVREYVETGSRALGCPPDAVALPLLAALGAAIGNARRIELKPGWSEPPLLWTCLVMASGRTKSPAQELALRDVSAAQDRAFARFRQAQGAHTDAVEDYKKRKRAWDRLDPAEAGEPPERPVRPVCERIEVANATLEAIVPILVENPKGLLVVADEIGMWIKSFDQYRQGRGGDREQWLSAHRAGRVVVDRKTDRETLFVPRAFVAVCGSIQPGILRRLVTEDVRSSGLLARLLVSYPDAPRKQWTEETVPKQVRDRLTNVFTRLFGLQLAPCADPGLGLRGARPDASASQRPVPVRLGAEAKRLWIDFYNEFAGEQHELAPDDDLGAAFSKLEAYAARFALIFSLVTWADGSAGTEPAEVDSESVRRGVALARWFARETDRIYTLLREGESDAELRKLLEWIRGRSRPVTVRDVRRGPRRLRGAPDEAQQLLDRAATSGFLWKRPIAAPAGGGHAGVEYELRRESNAPGAGDTRSEKSSPGNDLRGRASPTGGGPTANGAAP